MPAGIRTVYLLVRRCWPVPRQVGHGVPTTLPWPAQRRHGSEIAKKPWLTWRSPLPPQLC
jgi:hypothetical protein